MSTSTSENSRSRSQDLSNQAYDVYDVSDFEEIMREAMAPAPRMTVADWADEYRLLPSTSAEPGPWRTSRVPYMREIMQALSPSHPAQFVTVMKGSQVAGSEAGLNWIGYVINHSPGTMMIVFPGLPEVKRNTKERINPLIEDTPALRDRVANVRSRDAGNSMFRKEFRGGSLIMTGANSAAGLRSTPVRFLFLDEIDAYPVDVGGEGDPVDLAVHRTTTFQHRRKVYRVSTPRTHHNHRRLCANHVSGLERVSAESGVHRRSARPPQATYVRQPQLGTLEGTPPIIGRCGGELRG